MRYEGVEARVIGYRCFSFLSFLFVSLSMGTDATARRLFHLLLIEFEVSFLAKS